MKSQFERYKDPPRGFHTFVVKNFKRRKYIIIGLRGKIKISQRASARIYSHSLKLEQFPFKASHYLAYRTEKNAQKNTTDSICEVRIVKLNSKSVRSISTYTNLNYSMYNLYELLLRNKEKCSFVRAEFPE